MLPEVADNTFRYYHTFYPANPTSFCSGRTQISFIRLIQLMARLSTYLQFWRGCNWNSNSLTFPDVIGVTRFSVIFYSVLLDQGQHVMILKNYCSFFKFSNAILSRVGNIFIFLAVTTKSTKALIASSKINTIFEVAFGVSAYAYNIHLSKEVYNSSLQSSFAYTGRLACAAVKLGSTPR